MIIDELHSTSWLHPFDLLVMDEDGAQIVDSDGKEIIEADIGLITPWVKRFFPRPKVCPYCHHSLEKGTYKAELTEGVDPGEVVRRKCRLLYCRSCSYWQLDWQDFIPVGYHCEPGIDHLDRQDVFFLSKLCKFQYSLPEVVYSELAMSLRRRDLTWNSLQPTEFEKLVTAIFKANYADCEVLHVGQPDDGGRDVLFIDTAGNQWLIQCKCPRRADSSEGIETIRSLLGAMVLNDSSFGVVATTADHFTFRALQAVQRANEVGFVLKVLDRGRLHRMLGSLLPDRPWIDLVKAIDPIACSRLSHAIPSSKELLFPFWK